MLKWSHAEIPEVPVADAMVNAERGPRWLSQWKPWFVAAATLIVLACGPILWESIRTMENTSPGFTPR